MLNHMSFFKMLKTLKNRFRKVSLILPSFRSPGWFARGLPLRVGRRLIHCFRGAGCACPSLPGQNHRLFVACNALFFLHFLDVLNPSAPLALCLGLFSGDRLHVRHAFRFFALLFDLCRTRGCARVLRVPSVLVQFGIFDPTVQAVKGGKFVCVVLSDYIYCACTRACTSARTSLCRRERKTLTLVGESRGWPIAREDQAVCRECSSTRCTWRAVLDICLTRALFWQTHSATETHFLCTRSAPWQSSRLPQTLFVRAPRELRIRAPVRPQPWEHTAPYFPWRRWNSEISLFSWAWSELVSARIREWRPLPCTLAWYPSCERTAGSVWDEL